MVQFILAKRTKKVPSLNCTMYQVLSTKYKVRSTIYEIRDLFLMSNIERRMLNEEVGC